MHPALRSTRTFIRRPGHVYVRRNKDFVITTIEKYLPLALKLLELLRPKFYNRVTWAMVIAGLALMSSPLWQEVIKAIFDQKLHLPIAASNEMAWGYALCCTGLLYHLMSTGLHEVATAINSRGKKAQILEHDRQLFSNFDSQLSETHLRSIIDFLEINHAIRHDNSRILTDLIRIAKSSSTTFITQALKSKTEQLSTALHDLCRFISNDFDEYPYGQSVTNFQMCLAPQLNCDRAGSWGDHPKYDLLTDQLMSKTAAVVSAYEAWRLAVKATLYI